MRRSRRIMYASDFSRASRPAFLRAVEIARATRAELVITHVLAPVTAVLMDSAFIPPQTWDELDRGARAFAQNHLRALLRQAKKAGLRATTLLVEGSPAHSLVRAARGRHVDLLVLGTHGRTGLPRLLLGSVASRVVATARCPVLTVHAGERRRRSEAAAGGRRSPLGRSRDGARRPLRREA